MQQQHLHQCIHSTFCTTRKVLETNLDPAMQWKEAHDNGQPLNVKLEFSCSTITCCQKLQAEPVCKKSAIKVTHLTQLPTWLASISFQNFQTSDPSQMILQLVNTYFGVKSTAVDIKSSRIRWLRLEQSLRRPISLSKFLLKFKEKFFFFGVK